MMNHDGRSVTKREKSGHSVPRACFQSLWLVLALLITGTAIAQEAETAPADSPDQSSQAPVTSQPGGLLTYRPGELERSGIWVPLGSVPVDQAGAGRRGYVLPVEDSDVALAGANKLAIHAVAANNFYREETTDFLITQRYETHTVALDYRRGFQLRRLPRFEVGVQIQLHESDSGMLNGFIQGIENLWVSLSGYQASRNLLRTDGTIRPPQGTFIVRNGSVIYREGGSGSGLGDVTVTAKAALLDGDPASRVARVSARLGLNVAGSSPFTDGNFVGAGISLDKRLRQGMAFHGDVRVAHPLDRTSVWSLPLKRLAYGFSLGPEFKLPKHSSLALQIDGNTTPYLPTGTLAFDKGYGDLTFALGHRYKAGSRSVIAQLYVRENMNLPFRVRWNTDPDMSVGLKVSIH
jgi:hypothetical protein